MGLVRVVFYELNVRLAGRWHHLKPEVLAAATRHLTSAGDADEPFGRLPLAVEDPRL